MRSDQRRSFRCTVAEPLQDGQLLVAGAGMPIRLLDESAGGFAVLAEGPPGVAVGDTTQLDTYNGSYEVRVANLLEVELPPDDGEAAAGPRSAFRLGLCRVRDLDPVEEAQGASLGSVIRFCLRALLPSEFSLLGVGLILAIVVAATPIVVLLLLSDPGPAPIENERPAEPWLTSTRAAHAAARAQAAAARAAQRSAALAAERKPPPAEQRPVPPPPPQPSPAPAPPVVPTPPAAPPPATDADALRRMIRDLPGATVFALPAVIRQLKLSDAQQEQIRRIIDAVAAALQDLDLLADATTREELSEKRASIFERARRDALSTLTEEQRLRWRELSETKEAGGQ